MSKIKHVSAREILDSRGNPTVEAKVVLEDESIGIASCPSGASTGTHEAVELRDNDINYYNGKGVLSVVKNISDIIGIQLTGKDSTNQESIDDILIQLDGTPNKSKLGANATLPVSIAVLKAQSNSQKLPFYKLIQQITQQEHTKIPTPLFNILNGGKHAGENIDFQEFMVIPNPSCAFSEGLARGVKTYFSLKKLLEGKKLSTLVGDEGGFGPTLSSNEEALLLLKQATTDAGFEFAQDVFAGLDVASGSFYKDGKYILKENPNGVDANQLIELYNSLNSKYQLLYLEDGLFEDDFDNWAALVSKLNGTPTIITGDDLLVTNPTRLKTAIDKKSATGILIKLNQIGTVSETINVINMAKQAGIKTIVSHRSGETNDDFIADFAVGVSSDFVKFGAPARGERVAKYNRLLEIESELQTT